MKRVKPVKRVARVKQVRPVVRVRAAAKINLSLGVGSLRHDGYHQVRTVLQAVDLHDTLTFTARPGPFTIICSEPGIPTDSRNLIWKAAFELAPPRLWNLPEHERPSP
mgnify:CR=1 FL=1